jgi:hypothetical protein
MALDPPKHSHARRLEHGGGGRDRNRAQGPKCAIAIALDLLGQEKKT